MSSQPGDTDPFSVLSRSSTHFHFLTAGTRILIHRDKQVLLPQTGRKGSYTPMINTSMNQNTQGHRLCVSTGSCCGCLSDDFLFNAAHLSVLV